MTVVVAGFDLGMVVVAFVAFVAFVAVLVVEVAERSDGVLHV